MSEIFHTAVDADGVATLTWDLPGRSMNVMTMDGLQELNAAVDALIADEGVKGVILTSAKKDFAASEIARSLASPSLPRAIRARHLNTPPATSSGASSALRLAYFSVPRKFPSAK